MTVPPCRGRTGPAVPQRSGPTLVQTDHHIQTPIGPVKADHRVLPWDTK